MLDLAVIRVFRTGIVYSNRKEDGTLKEQMPAKGYLVTGVSFLLVLVFLVLCDYFTFRGISAGLVRVLLFNMLLITSLSLCDGLVIDLWVLGIIGPRFLRLPDALPWTS